MPNTEQAIKNGYSRYDIVCSSHEANLTADETLCGFIPSIIMLENNVECKAKGQMVLNFSFRIYHTL